MNFSCQPSGFLILYSKNVLLKIQTLRIAISFLALPHIIIDAPFRISSPATPQRGLSKCTYLPMMDAWVRTPTALMVRYVDCQIRPRQYTLLGHIFLVSFLFEENRWSSMHCEWKYDAFCGRLRENVVDSSLISCCFFSFSGNVNNESVRHKTDTGWPFVIASRITGM